MRNVAALRSLRSRRQCGNAPALHGYARPRGGATGGWFSFRSPASIGQFFDGVAGGVPATRKYRPSGQRDGDREQPVADGVAFVGCYVIQPGGLPFRRDGWTRPGGGYPAPKTPAASAPQGGAPGLGRPGAGLEGDGLSQIIEEGHVLERGGCNFSHVKGASLPPSATQHRGELAGAPFEALGVSLVMHPRNPYVPTVHMNVRLLAAFPPGREPVSWFGGGMDLTPYYGFEDDARHFHRICHDAVAPFGADLHPRFKTWCDEYFFLKHRNEPRGVGGIFFDDFNEGSLPVHEIRDWTGAAVPQSYCLSACRTSWL